MSPALLLPLFLILAAPVADQVRVCREVEDILRRLACCDAIDLDGAPSDRLFRNVTEDPAPGRMAEAEVAG